MPVSRPDPQTWTLRFKHERTTIFLSVDPLQRLASIRAELLGAIQQSHPDGDFDGLTIPQDPDEILLARPIDQSDLSRGWQAMDSLDDEEASSGLMTGKGKGKAGLKNTPNVSKVSATDSARASGLVDGDILAFKFQPPSADLESRTNANNAENDEGLLANASEEWNVVVPTMEDSFAEEDTDGERMRGILASPN